MAKFLRIIISERYNFLSLSFTPFLSNPFFFYFSSSSFIMANIEFTHLFHFYVDRTMVSPLTTNHLKNINNDYFILLLTVLSCNIFDFIFLFSSAWFDSCRKYNKKLYCIINITLKILN